MPRYPRELLPFAPESVPRLTTRQLLGLRDRLLRLEEAPDVSDRRAHELDPALLQFKSDPRWKPLHAALAAELSKREHLPTGEERAARRANQSRRKR